jgi:hypothetical protein
VVKILGRLSDSEVSPGELRRDRMDYCFAAGLFVLSASRVAEVWFDSKGFFRQLDALERFQTVQNTVTVDSLVYVLICIMVSYTIVNLPVP